MSLPPIGAAAEGGFIGAYISLEQDGVPTHALIVSPRSTETSISGNLQASVTPETSPIDGPANTASWVAAGQNKAIYCADLSSGGYSDWYLPARLELDAIYWNLKPGTQENVGSGRSNSYAIPPRPTPSQTASSPAQTEISEFQEAGTEAFNSNGVGADYYAMSSATITFHRSLSFRWGVEAEPSGTGGTNRVRAIRRVAVAQLLEPVPETAEEIFQSQFAEASGAAPWPSALQSAARIQRLADHNVLQFLGRPRWYELPVYIGYGELDQFQLGTVRTFRADLPGLRDGKKLMIMGRDSGTRPGFIRLLCRG